MVLLAQRWLWAGVNSLSGSAKSFLFMASISKGQKYPNFQEELLMNLSRMNRAKLFFTLFLLLPGPALTKVRTQLQHGPWLAKGAIKTFVEFHEGS